MRLNRVRYEAVMSGRTVAFLFATSLFGLAGAIATHGPEQAPTGDPSLSQQEHARLLAKGKEIFLDRCARCHNESGDKPLRTGAPLNQRGLSTEVIAQAVNGRLRDRTEEERSAVTLYISSLMQNKKPGTKDKNTSLPINCTPKKTSLDSRVE